MTNFQWQEQHLEWFLRTFKGEIEELAARDITARYRPRRGEPRKGRSKKGEQTIDAQDFRNLMRLMVLNKYARVTNSYQESRNYKIRMVSDDYPFIQEAFDRELFNHPFIKKPLPGVEEVKNTYLTSVEGRGDASFDEAYKRSNTLGSLYVEAFRIHNYEGGDFDLILHLLDEPPMQPSDIADQRELFILHVRFFIAVYKAFKIGLPELQKMVEESDCSCPQDHDTFFTVIFGHQLVEGLYLRHALRDRNMPPHRTLSNIAVEIDKLALSEQKIPDNLIASVYRGFVPGEEGALFLQQGYAGIERIALKVSDRLEVQNASKKVEEAFTNIVSYWRTRFNRSR